LILLDNQRRAAPVVSRLPQKSLRGGNMQRISLMIVLLFILALAAGAEADVQAPSASPAQAAPDFTLPDQDGKMWKLNDVVKEYRAVVLAFYPKDDTGV